MPARTCAAARGTGPGIHSAVCAAGWPATGRPLRRRLVIVAPDAAETAGFVGGWLVDRVLAGWEATVLRADDDDPLPLRILGARPASLEPVLRSSVLRCRPHAVAVHAGLYDRDPRVRRVVEEALGAGTAEVTLWGGPRLVDPDAAGALPHRPSRAARVFKARALAAAAAPLERAGAVEVFHRAGPLAWP